MPNSTENVKAMAGEVSGYAFKGAADAANKKFTPEMSKVRSAPSGFDLMGFIGDGGVPNARSTESEDKKDLNGTVIGTIKTGYDETFKFVLCERSKAALQVVYGDANVTEPTAGGSAKTGVIKHTGGFDATRSYLFRFVSGETDTTWEYTDLYVPYAKVTEVGEAKYSGTGFWECEVTVKALPDASGVNAYEYTNITNK